MSKISLSVECKERSAVVNLAIAINSHLKDYDLCSPPYLNV